MSQINPVSQTIDSILKEFEEIKVPLNQRGFEWGRDQASDFWNDLIDAMEDENKKVFLGTIVLKTEDGKNSASVVDGQQRLTTISLLLIAIREIEKRKLKLKEAAKTLNDTYLSSSDIMATVYRPKLKVSHHIADVFNEMASFNWKGEFVPKIGTKQVKLQIRRIRPIYELFIRNIEENKFNTEEKIKYLLDTLRNRCYFVVIKIQGDLEALDIFERMNARGIELNAAELLKNHLFTFTRELPEEEVSTQWDEIFKNADYDLVRVLRYFYISLEGPIRKTDLYKKTKVLVKELGPREFLNRLGEFSGCYYNFIKADRKDLEEYIKEDIGRRVPLKEYVLDSICDSMEALKLFRISQYMPVVGALYERITKKKEPIESDVSEFARLLKSLESFHFINNAICRKPNNEIEKFYAEKSLEIAKSDKSIKTLVDSVTSGLEERKEKIDSFTENFTELAYEPGEASFKIIYYIFDRLNNKNRKGGDRNHIYNTDVRLSKKNFNIDHMNPKKAENTNKKLSLYSYTNEDDAEHINNIGNLMVISLHANSRAQNMPLSTEKIEQIYKKYGLKLPNVAQFVESFKARDWSTKEKIFKSIERRAKELAHEIYRGV